MINLICPVCENKSWIVRKEKPSAWRTTGEKFNLLECSTCKVIKTFPVIDSHNVKKYYNFKNYDSHKVTNESKGLFNIIYNQIKYFNAHQKIKLIKKHLYKKDSFNLIDYGCGNGSFMEILKSKSIPAEGVEFDEKLIESLKYQGKKVYSVDEFHSLNKKYDVITLFHVFEHLHNPNFSIDKFKSKLNNKGLLVLALPNPESFDCTYYGSNWAAWDVPIHYHHFTKKVIVDYIESKGFVHLKTKPLYFDSFYVSYLSEKIKKSKIPFLKGFFIGLYSNILAAKSGNYSSLMYVFQKL